ncbi:hypothetical protein CC2G_001460 [Coprinopsis cinerea AmutBmut pab1-1]|nr:hypothetical protein CC2G_001460 [Coprinopsis cinerea AmutBmut pab1-1]
MNVFHLQCRTRPALQRVWRSTSHTTGSARLGARRLSIRKLSTGLYASSNSVSASSPNVTPNPANANTHTPTTPPARPYSTRSNFDFSTSSSSSSSSGSSSRISQTFDGLGKHTSTDARHDSVGPFQLGLSQQALRTGQKLPKWSELDTKGKVLRTTARTTNLTVILLGAGLSVLLIYSLTSELFSKNSATVIYGEACDKIRNSPKIAKYLNGPLTFHNNPPSASRPRHRSRHVTSQVLIDAYGQEHMILSFYVRGSSTTSSSQPSYMDENLSYYERADLWIKDKFNNVVGGVKEMDVDGVVEWTKETAGEVWEKSVRAFKYLSGAPVNVSSVTPASSKAKAKAEDEGAEDEKKSSVWDSVFGLFSGLKGSVGQGGPGVVGGASGRDERKFVEGDVHADLVRNKDGYFVFRYLLVDMPHSKDPNAVRVFVERAPGVRDNEPVMRWVTSSS